MTKVLVPLAQGCEELEAITITDLLVRAGIEVTTAGLDDKPVKASRGIRILPDTNIDQVVNNDYDLVVECSGSPSGLELASKRIRPRGTIVLKSTYAEKAKCDLSLLVFAHQHPIDFTGRSDGDEHRT